MNKHKQQSLIANARKILPVAIIAIIVLHLFFQYLRATYPDIDFIVDISNRFNVDDEVSLPTWYSISLLLSLSVASYWLSLQKKAYRLWRPAAALFLIMSIDEGSGFHELLITPLRNAFDIEGSSLIYNAWIIVGVFVVGAIGIKMLQLLKDVPSKRTKTLMLAGFAIYASGIILFEAIGGLFIDNETIYRTWIVLIEESLELTGLSLIAISILDEMGTQTK